MCIDFYCAIYVQQLTDIYPDKTHQSKLDKWEVQSTEQKFIYIWLSSRTE